MPSQITIPHIDPSLILMSKAQTAPSRPPTMVDNQISHSVQHCGSWWLLEWLEDTWACFCHLKAIHHACLLAPFLDY